LALQQNAFLSRCPKLPNLKDSFPLQTNNLILDYLMCLWKR
jgi:hypothetical protein